MSTPKPSPDDQARRYIDEIMEINRTFGMDGNVSEDIYNEAVCGAADAFRGLADPRFSILKSFTFYAGEAHDSDRRENEKLRTREELARAVVEAADKLKDTCWIECRIPADPDDHDCAIEALDESVAAWKEAVG